MINNGITDQISYYQDTNIINQDLITENGFIQFTNMDAILDLQTYTNIRVQNWRIDSANSTAQYDNSEYIMSYDKNNNNNNTWSITGLTGNEPFHGGIVNQPEKNKIIITNAGESITLESVGVSNLSSEYQISENTSFSFKHTNPADYTENMRLDTVHLNTYSDARVINTSITYEPTEKRSTVTYGIDLNMDDQVDIESSFTAHDVQASLREIDVRKFYIHVFEPPRVTKIHFGSGNDAA